MSRWLGVLFMLMTFHTHSGLLTAQEEKTKADIYKQYNTESILIEMNEVQSNSRNLEIESKDKSIQLAEYQDLLREKMQEFEESLLSSKRAELSNNFLPVGSTTPQAIFQDLEELAANISQIEIKEDIIAKKLANFITKFESLKQDFKRTRSQKNTQLLALREVILDRYISEVSSAKTIKYKGNIPCGTRKSIRDCMNSISLDKLILIKAQESLPVSKIDILEHKYSSFSLDLNGKAKFEVTVRFTGTFSSNISEKINEELGISAFEVVILSNRDDAKHFINGDYVGKGKRISATVNAGQNAFYSLVSNKKESVVEMITDNHKLTFNF